MLLIISLHCTNLAFKQNRSSVNSFKTFTPPPHPNSQVREVAGLIAETIFGGGKFIIATTATPSPIICHTTCATMLVLGRHHRAFRVL